MTNHTPAKVDSYSGYTFMTVDVETTKFLWECSCGDSASEFETFVDAYDDVSQHCDTANEQLIVDVSVKLLDIANHKKNHQYDFMALAKHVLENGYRA